MKRFIPISIFLVLVLLQGCLSPTALRDRKNRVVKGKELLRIYVVRHAQAYKNTPQPFGTPKEKLDSLTPRGQKQAAAVGAFLKGKGVVAVITSPTGRTRQTAQAITKALELSPRASENKAFASLRKGLTADGKPLSWAWRKKQWRAGGDPRPRGGESLADGITRAVGAVKKLAEQFPGKAIAIATHGDICAALLGEAEETPIPKRYATHSVEGGSVSEIVITDAGWALLSQGTLPAQP